MEKKLEHFPRNIAEAQSNLKDKCPGKRRNNFSKEHWDIGRSEDTLHKWISSTVWSEPHLNKKSGILSLIRSNHKQRWVCCIGGKWRHRDPQEHQYGSCTEAWHHKPKNRENEIYYSNENICTHIRNISSKILVLKTLRSESNHVIRHRKIRE